MTKRNRIALPSINDRVFPNQLSIRLNGELQCKYVELSKVRVCSAGIQMFSGLIGIHNHWISPCQKVFASGPAYCAPHYAAA